MTDLQNILTNPFVQRVGWSLLHFLWQGAAVAVLLAGTLWLLRRRSSNLRYVVACSALVLMLALPAATMWLVEPVGRLGRSEAESHLYLRPLDPAYSSEVRSLERNPQGEDFAETHVRPSGTEKVGLAPRSGLRPLGPAYTAAVVEPTLPWRERAGEIVAPALPWIVCGWLIGVLALSAWHVRGWIQVQRLRRVGVRPAGQEITEVLTRLCNRLGIGRAVRAVESALVCVPTVVGCLKPIILLPASALTGLTGEQLEAILAHELAHIRRHDYLINLLQTAAETLLFYHPAAWWVSRRIRAERENCCDDLAVAASGRPLVYARALTAVAKLSQPQRRLAVAADGGGGGEKFLARIRRIVGLPTGDTSRRGRWLAGTFTLLAVLAIVIALGISCATDKIPADKSPATHTGATQAAQNGSPYKAFVGFRVERIKRGLIPTAVLIGSIQPDGRATTRLLPTDKLNHADRPRAVEQGKLYIRGAVRSLILDLRSGGAREVKADDPEIAKRPAVDDARVRGGQEVLWTRDTKQVAVFQLVLRDVKTMESRILWDKVRYVDHSISDWVGRQPPVIWLDDHHLMTVHTASTAGLAQPSENHVVLVDIRTKKVTELGAVPGGSLVILPPRGEDGDAGVITDPGIGHSDKSSATKVYAVSVSDALAGHGKLEQRAIRWGQFTLGGDLMPYGNGLVGAKSLTCGATRLAKRANVSVSPDGRRALWITYPDNPNIDGATLYYCDSGDKRVHEVAKAAHFEMPIWTSQAGIATQPATQPEKETEKIVWGETVKGLQSGLSFDLQDRPYRVGELVSFRLHVRNTGKKDATLADFVAGDPKNDCVVLISWSPSVRDSTGKLLPMSSMTIGMPVRKRVRTLAPGHTTVVGTILLKLDVTPEDRPRPHKPHLFLKPGTYRISQTYRFNQQQEATWSGEVTTGELALTVAPSTAATQIGESEAAADDISRLLTQFQSEKDRAKRERILYDLTEGRKPGVTDKKRIGNALLKIARTSENTDARWYSIRGLGYLKYKEATPFLIECLRDQHRYVRANAARALGEIKAKSASAQLISLLGREKDGGVVEQTSLALCKLEAKEAVGALKKVAGHANHQTRGWVLQAIGKLGTERDVPFLADFLDDTLPGVPHTAARAIERITGEDFGFPKLSGPVNLEPAINRARQWWEQNKNRLKKQNPPATQPAWGKANSGVQARLRPDKKMWAAKQTPTFRADIHNAGSGTYTIVPFQHEIEMDNVRYRWTGFLKRISELNNLSPGKMMDGIPVALTDNWRTKGNKPLKLTPGKHTLRVIFFCDGGSSHENLVVETKPVEFEVAAAGVRVSEMTYAALRVHGLRPVRIVTTWRVVEQFYSTSPPGFQARQDGRVVFTGLIRRLKDNKVVLVASADLLNTPLADIPTQKKVEIPRDAIQSIHKFLPTTQPATKPAGSKLEFRIAPYHPETGKKPTINKTALKWYLKMLGNGQVGRWWVGKDITGVVPDHAWLPVRGGGSIHGALITAEHKGQRYLLVSDKPGQTMLPAKGKNVWGLAKVYATTDSLGRPAVGFELDDRGAKLFATLTKANINNVLAVVVDGKVVSAPVLKTALGKRGMIVGRFSEQEVKTLVKALKTGMPPATQPVSMKPGTITLDAHDGKVRMRKGKDVLEAAKIRISRLPTRRPLPATQPTGVFYLMGEIQRPGIYTMTGRKVTLKKALAAAGYQPGKKKDMAAVLFRQSPDGKEEVRLPVDIDAVFAGKEPDLFLQANDVVLVRQGKSGKATTQPSARYKREFYVMGDVQRPGVYSMAGRKINIKMALAAAGYQPGKKKDMVAVLIRRLPDGTQKTITLDIEAILTGKRPDVLLQANDVVVVRHRKTGKATTQPAKKSSP